MKKIMIIEKVFSNIEDPEETLYSVLMSEDEIANSVKLSGSIDLIACEPTKVSNWNKELISPRPTISHAPCVSILHSSMR